MAVRRPRPIVAHAKTADSGWSGLYRTAGMAALAVAVIIPFQIIAFIIWPSPLQGSASEWFALFQRNPIAGLINLDLLLVADNLLGIPITLALYMLLRRSSRSIVTLAAATALLGIICSIVVNPAIQMFMLSERYAAASSAEQVSMLAAGQAMLSNWQGTAFHVAYIVSSVAWIAISAVMLRGTMFGRAIAYLGIAANTIGLGLYVPVVGLFLSVFSVLFLEAWYILLGHRLLRLAGATQPHLQGAG
jgi:hypothetical protein